MNGADATVLDRLEAELALTCGTSPVWRATRAVLGVLPGDAPPDGESADALLQGESPPTLELLGSLGRTLAASHIDQALFAARSIDTGDTGLTVWTGLRTAFAMFRGGAAAALGGQQETDVVLKAVGLAFIISRLVPGDRTTAVDRFAELPWGARFLDAVATFEIALPFRGQVSFLEGALARAGGSAGSRIQAVIGKAGLQEATVLLPRLVATLDARAALAGPKVDEVAQRVANLVPRVAAPIHDLAAAGVDALPVWRALAVRAAIQAAAAAEGWRARPPRVGVAAPSAGPEPTPATPTNPPGASAASSSEPPLEPTPAPPEPLPRERRMAGAWLSSEGTWLWFGDDGRYWTRPEHRPGSVTSAGTYLREGESLTLTPSQGAAHVHVLRREGQQLALDDVSYTRMDWDLTGRTLDGRWTSPDGAHLHLGPDARWTWGARSGAYRLAPATLVRVGDDGSEDTHILLTDLVPRSGAPDRLWLDGLPWRRT